MTSVYVLAFITLCITFGPSIATFHRFDIVYDLVL
ncbi:hypothetical protein NB566_18340 [Vibrio parahaemolyticus]|nr:hypothetical protein [Vibrio parahaemolyticus]